MVNLKPDCESCAALCCLALAIDSSDMFAFDKPAGEPCQHLKSDFRCGIHDRLHQAGCSGCVRYDCLGAGQRVVNEVFAGKNWQGAPALKAPMIEAFAQMRALHELALLLKTAAGLPLSGEQRQQLDVLENDLGFEQGWSADKLKAFELGPIAKDIRQFLQSLKPVLENFVSKSGSSS
ncbi:MAG: hypothetical protein L3J37_11190 [Rhodobacteraceae bacterium]|nr:hypothetical protein [Paracoccaceae bacterium]